MTVYYVDNVNGNDAHAGDKSGAKIIDSTVDTTHFVDVAMSGFGDDAFNGDFFYNRTRSLSSLITDYTSATGAFVLATPITGMAIGDDYYIIRSWKTIGKATTTIAAGDIAYVRAGTTYLLAAICNCTNDGTPTSYIKLIGMGTGTATLETTDGTATEAWHDASTVRPIIDCNSADYYLYVYLDDYWRVENIAGTNTTYAYGALAAESCRSPKFINCYFYDNIDYTIACGIGIYGLYTPGLIQDCVFTNNRRAGVRLAFASAALVKGCVFNGGAGSGAGCQYGIEIIRGRYFMQDCTFGVATAFIDGDFGLYDGNSFAIGRNITLTAPLLSAGYDTTPSWISIEGYQGVEADHIQMGVLGKVYSERTIVRAGGAVSSAKIIPTTYVNVTTPINLSNSNPFDFAVWCPASATTISIYVRGLNWASFPTAAQLNIVSEYLNHATNATRLSVTSTQVLTDNTTWTALTTTFTPAQAGFVYVKLNLSLYEDATTGIYVDIKPVIS
jgi:hypothetical protein